MTDTIFAKHYSDISYWPGMYFKPKELACSHCGEILIKTQALTKIDKLRALIGKPLVVNSAYRCPKHNADIGGSPVSQHKLGEAFDISLKYPIMGIHNRKIVTELAKEAGFTAIGQYDTFIHMDDRVPKPSGELYVWDLRTGKNTV